MITDNFDIYIYSDQLQVIITLIKFFFQRTEVKFILRGGRISDRKPTKMDLAPLNNSPGLLDTRSRVLRVEELFIDEKTHPFSDGG